MGEKDNWWGRKITAQINIKTAYTNLYSTFLTQFFKGRTQFLMNHTQN